MSHKLALLYRCLYLQSLLIVKNKQRSGLLMKKNMMVNPRRVKPGLMAGSTMQVEGLNPGERVVVAGAPYLRKNMKVTLLGADDQPQ